MRLFLFVQHRLAWNFVVFCCFFYFLPHVRHIYNKLLKLSTSKNKLEISTLYKSTLFWTAKRRYISTTNSCNRPTRTCCLSFSIMSPFCTVPQFYHFLVFRTATNFLPTQEIPIWRESQIFCLRYSWTLNLCLYIYIYIFFFFFFIFWGDYDIIRKVLTSAKKNSTKYHVLIVSYASQVWFGRTGFRDLKNGGPNPPSSALMN